MPVEKPKFQVALLLDSAAVSKYVLEFVKWCQSHERLEISYVFVHSAEQKARRAAEGDSPERVPVLFSIDCRLGKASASKEQAPF